MTIKNTGSEPLSMVLVFSAPGFENLMRCESVLPNEKSTPISPEEYKKCEHEEEPEEKAK